MDKFGEIMKIQPGSDSKIVTPVPLSDSEYRRRLAEWNSTAIAYPEENFCLHQLIEAQVERTPHQTALVYEDQALSYDDLNRRANRLAQELMRRAVGPNVCVGLFVGRSLEMVVGILGILKAGGAFVPMDVTFPQERLAFLLADANINLLLTQSGLAASLPPGSSDQTVWLDTFDWTEDAVPAKDRTPVSPDDLAYVIYTSGSTGRPKGVCVEHRHIVNYVLGVTERLKFRSGMKHATVSTIAADLGNTVIFPALATGGCLHIISQERCESQAKLSEYFNREAIDVLKIVPSHLAALQTGRNPELVMPKARLILGGEATRLDWLERLRALTSSCEIYNHYGPTETTVGVLTYNVGPQLPRTESGTLPIGKPLPNSRVYILDDRGQPVMIGDKGEICIGGLGVARGYLNRPDLTAEKFIPDPFAPEPGGRMYRTGDAARYLPDGNIEFCGRIDSQVKIHGYRIELGEVEEVLRGHDGVRDAVVLAIENDSAGNQLVAYIVPERLDQPLWEDRNIYVLPDGTPVAQLNKNETDYIYNEIFILQAYLRHGITISDGDCIVDAGANIGMFTIFASRLARNLRIFSFEPLSAQFACLKANADAIGAAVKCLPVGLSRENKLADFTFFEGFSLFSGYYADAAKERDVVKKYVINQDSESQKDGRLDAAIDDLIDGRFQAKRETVKLRTLSDVMVDEGIERIDLLKINVEKSELDVLQGLRSGDWNKIRQIVLEVDLEDNIKPITSLLKQYGFEYVVEQDPLLSKTELCYIYAIRPSKTGPRLIQQQAAYAHIRSLLPDDRKILTPATLRVFMRDRLPQYMIPSSFVLKEKFPLTLNGKIDRQVLLASFHADIPIPHKSVPPRTEAEKALTSIWAELLKVDNFGIDDDFFDLGGHSLLAIRAISRIRDVFEVDLPTQILFSNPTISTLAKAIMEAQGSLKPIPPIGLPAQAEKKFVIKRFTEDLVSSVKEFNARLDAHGAPTDIRFPEHPVPTWLPKVDHAETYQEFFVVMEDAVVRGCFKLKHQPFSFFGKIRPVELCHWPVSEGIIDNKYASVYFQILETILEAQPLQYGSAMRDPVPSILTGLGWKICQVPLYFKVQRPRNFLKEMGALRRAPIQKMMMKIAGETRIAGLGLKMLQSFRSIRSIRSVQTEIVGGFSRWADDLWDICKDRYAMIGLRDQKTLNLLYPSGSQFIRQKVSLNGTVLGWAVLLDSAHRNHKYYGNLRVGSIVDCLAAPEDAYSLIRAATRALEDRGVDLLVTNLSHRSWTDALRKSGYFQGPSKLNFGVSKKLGALLDPFNSMKSQIHLTRGDGEGPLSS
jgi:amino acid adenylation domain-containing protein/FkbM family methyltransferase